MTYSVKIAQHDQPVTVEMGQTILEAALAQDVPYPHGCRSGNCGACKSRLVSGNVDLSPHSEFALTDEEKSRGLVLACRSVPWEDVEIAWMGEDDLIAHPLRKMVCRVTALDRMTHDINLVRMDIISGGPFIFSAGQFTSVAFDTMPPRDYSIANPPADPGLEFHIRRIPGGIVSTFVQENLSVGDEVRVEGPFGSSWLRETHRGPVIAIAGGSGLAPIKSIVEQALNAGMEQEIRLYFGVRDENDLYLADHLAALAETHANLVFVPVLSEPAGETTRRTGFVHEAVREDMTDPDGAKAYLAGPPPMVEAATVLLEELGLRQEDIHADPFYTEAEKAVLENGND